MADELIDIFDENNNFLGVSKMKSVAHKEGLWHRSVYVLMYNSKCELLMQLRSKNKSYCPDKWDISVAGHVGAGEEPISAAMREIHEELGVRVSGEELKFKRTGKSEDKYLEFYDREIFYVYFLKFDCKAEDLVLQEEEVQKVKFVSIEELEQDLAIHRDRYVSHDEFWEEAIADLKKLRKETS